ncbi:MAG: hypothetical protein U0871_17190 [Gemmataceae bacterium]
MAVLTRNGYRAVCLNTPDVLFAGIDFEPPLPPGLLWYVAGAAVLVAVAAYRRRRWLQLLVMGVLVWLLVGRGWPPAGLARRAVDGELQAKNGRRPVRRPPPGLASAGVPDAGRGPGAGCPPHLRPAQAGGRVLPGLGVDPVYARMCSIQGCFRAGQPEEAVAQAGVTDHIRPRPGCGRWTCSCRAGPSGWPRYEQRAAEGTPPAGSCTPPGTTSRPAAARPSAAHDVLCRAESDLPLA